MDPTTAPSGGRGRFRTPDKPSAAERQQAREVSLKRIARLFTPYRGSVIIVVAIIAAAAHARQAPSPRERPPPR